MLLEILVAIFAGILAGTFTGLTPGIHVNLVAALLLSFSPALLMFLPAAALIAFIVAMSITHTFVDFIPSILLGSPDEDTGLSVLPGHELLNKGRGYSAIIYTLYGSLAAIPVILFFTPIFMFVLPKVYIYFQKAMFLILLVASIYLLLRQDKKILGFLAFLASGFLGIAVFGFNTLKEPLLPLLTGLFGGSSLITSIIKKTKIPPQELQKKVSLPKKEFFSSISAAMLAAPLCSFLPALGSNQAAIIASDLSEKPKNTQSNRRSFLFLLGSLNTIVMGLSFISLYSISKIRTGSAAAVKQLSPLLSTSEVFVILAAICLSGIISFFITKNLARFFSRYISKINYQIISTIILIFITLIVLLFSGLLGFLVFIISAFLGLSIILLNIRRTNLLGCLMIPTILLYLPI